MKKYRVFQVTDNEESFQVEFESKEEAEGYIKGETERYKIFDPWSHYYFSEVDDTVEEQYERGA